jgi:AcrR family transcriptional regulator
MATATNRHTAEDRREAVLDAAVKEFAASGYHAASTTAIARRAGISQPYIYALFPNKEALFLACQERSTRRIRDAFLAAAEGAKDADEALERMGEAYSRLLEDRDELLCQLHGFAAAGDPAIRGPVADGFMAVIDELEEITGAPAAEVRNFIAKGMYLNIAHALELPDRYCHPS